SPIEVGAELAHLADVCLDAAIAHHRAALVLRHGPPLIADEEGGGEAELVVIGMGKLGGEELNFASDIDLIYAYTTDAGEAGELSLHQFFSKLCERVTAALSEVTDEDTVFRVDLRLRPEGSRGAIANSLPSMERYYETWGRPWERQAWLKARPSAGSRELGRQVLATLAPFVYPRHTSPSIVADVRDLNRRIKVELDRSGVDSGYDVKNGAGGIREIEFFAQALQLIHAGQRPALRTRSTIGVLDQLLFAGIISESERSQLAGAYRALRRIEHLLQLETGRQTQRLPTDPAAFELVARRLGHDGAADLIAALADHTAAVARHFATLGSEEDGPPDAVVALLSGENPPETERRLLAQLGLRDIDRAVQYLDLARRRASSPFGRAAEGAGARVAPLLLADVVASPDPDQALAHVAELSHRRGSWTALWRMMDDSPHLRRLVASLFGTSEYLSKQFLDHPELFDALLAAGKAHPRVSQGELDQMARARLAEVAAGDDEACWSALAELKNAQVLRIGLADIAGELRADEVCRELSDMAEVCLQQGHELVGSAMRERHGQARDEDGGVAGLAVLALGKLGGRELGYASDLDVVFVYAADGDSDGERPLANVTYMTRLAQRLMGGLHTRHPGGRLYDVDTRLRPSGSKGLLVSSLSAWQRYHGESARLWERQALTRLRPVAGDPELGARAAAVAARCVYGAPPGADGRESAAAMADSMMEMRDRIERELAGGSAVDMKAGRGGLIDIEFASQFVQLALGHRHESLRTPSTVAALRAAAELAASGAIPGTLVGPCSLLADAYLYLRRVEHRIRMVHDASEQRLPTDPVAQGVLARRLGLADGSSLLEGYRRWTDEVRRAYDAIMRSADLRAPV
ncbi:MAG TPA: bifunctional [glutamate--ammonia ligase]-adenylyl-L-tyrosine phosphorylase/[glutamate--ammonia-ligase] adenylyltransferase, partial [Kofleriaceae bacterium]|nr:bifunctional [glutamate--ammonia ligase]-adenylyl-L-tyrosine phosphorylase/[glutamate--ammonia-ligase] adenylyltransferase [Kofleriaceae bacterium]